MGRHSIAFVAVGLTLVGGAALFLIYGDEHAQDRAHEEAHAPGAASSEHDRPVLHGLSEEAARAQRARAVSRWQEGITSEDGAIRLATVKAWEQSGKEYGALAADLVPLLADWKPDVREAAREAFVELGASGVEVLVRDGLSSSDVEVPALSIEMLGRLAEKGGVKEAVGSLVEILDNPARSRALRERAATSLGRVRPVSEEVRTALLRASRDPNDEIAASAIEGLGLLGPEGERHLTHLLALLADEERPTLHPDALRALGTVGRQPDVIIPILFKRWEHASSYDPHTAPAIARFGSASLPHVSAALASESPSRVGLALQVVLAMDREAASLAEDLVGLLRRDVEAAQSVSVALIQIGPAAARVIPDLVGLIDSAPRTLDRCAILRALAGLGPDGAAALQRLLESGDVRLRAGVVYAIAGCPGVDTPTRSRLQDLADKDGDAHVRRAATWTLKVLASK